ncbi:MAG: TlpA disulfide reductase family protein, partial [Pyrinomonadaceae bacterium]
MRKFFLFAVASLVVFASTDFLGHNSSNVKAVRQAASPVSISSGKASDKESAKAKSSRRGKKTPLPVQVVDGEGLFKLFNRDPSNPRPLLVNFWATWCEPCRVEFPDLVKINKEYEPHGLEFITISLDELSEMKTGVPKFLREVKANMPAYLLDVMDPDPVINKLDPNWAGNIPTTFLFD